MSHTFYSSVIFVKNIEQARKFYSEVLDQEIEHDFGSNIMFKSRLSLWQINEEHEISNIAGDPNEGNTFELYFETNDIQKSSRKIKASEVKLPHDIKTEPWGQMTIRFFDVDGHLIEIGESMKVFILRIYNETLSVKETSTRTGVPVKTIRKIVTRKTH